MRSGGRGASGACDWGQVSWLVATEIPTRIGFCGRLLWPLGSIFACSDGFEYLPVIELRTYRVIPAEYFSPITRCVVSQ